MDQDIFTENNNFHITNVFKLIFRNIWIIILSIILALGIAYIYNKYSIPVYKVSSSLLLKEDSGNNRTYGESRFINSDLLSRNQNLKNELEIINSQPNIEETIRNLNLEVSYYEYKNYRYHNAYKKAPFKVFIYKNHPQLVGVTFNIEFISDGSYLLTIEKQDASIYDFSQEQTIGEKKDLELKIEGKFGQVIENNDFKFLITINNEDKLPVDEEKLFAFKIRTINQLVAQLHSKLQLNIPDELSTVIEISLETTSVQQGKDIINELIQVYSANNLAQKNHLAKMTIDYIEKQLDEVSTSLNSTENNLQRIKSENRLMNINEQATRLSEQRLDLQNQLAELRTKQRYYDYIKEYNENNTNQNQIITPSSMGVNDPLLNNLINELSSAQSQKANLIENNQERNPIVARLEIQIQNLKNTISENIEAAILSNNTSINEMQDRINRIENELSELPETQRQMGGIERNQNLNSTIYNYLLEKRAEAKITQASNLPDNKVIEPAHMVGLSPISPNKMRNYIFALFLGFILPVSVLLLKVSLKTTVSTQEEIESITNAPVIGKVFHYNKGKEKSVFTSSPNNKTAETFRTLRTNINFILNGSPHKTIMVTSCVSGEGKTFNSLNIAEAFAQMGKKTILVNFDLRKSNSILFKNTSNKNGLSLFLNDEVTLDQIIQKTEYKNLDFINSGPIPPNPLELMEKSNVDDLFKSLKQSYDYIIIDTPPLAQVSDAITIIEHASLNLLITRYNFTKKKLLKVVLKELKNKKISNVYLILNDNKLVSEQMGYGYYEK